MITASVDLKKFFRNVSPVKIEVNFVFLKYNIMMIYYKTSLQTCKYFVYPHPQHIKGRVAVIVACFFFNPFVIVTIKKCVNQTGCIVHTCVPYKKKYPK